MKRWLVKFLFRGVIIVLFGTILFFINWIWSLQACVPGYTYGKFVGLDRRARLSLAIGNNGRAERLARQLLDIAPQYRTDWNYGNAIHHANQVLGRVALRKGDLSGARSHLLKSTDILGSPQLDTFGPNMRLAKELLDAGEAAVVLDYLERCRTFWEMGIERIDYWQDQIRDGQTPKFGSNLDY